MTVTIARRADPAGVGTSRGLEVDERHGGYRSLNARPGVAPPEPTYGPAVTIEVDRETFEFRPNGRGGTHDDWLSGLNDGYGFTVSATEDCSIDDHRGHIRDFLNQIDPATASSETERASSRTWS